MNKQFLIFLTCVPALFSGPMLCAQAPRVVDDAYLDMLRAEARTNHPTVAAAQARLRAAEAGVRAVRLWEDPMAGLSVMAAERARRADDGDIIAMAEQALPRRGLYEARKAKARAEQAVFQAETHSAALNLETIVAQAAVELALADETLIIQSNQVTWLERMAGNARQKLVDPAGSAAEPLRIEAELAQERQRLDSAARRRTSLARQLNNTLGRAEDQPWPHLSLPAEASSMATLAAEMARLGAANPMLGALFSTAAAAKAEIDVARQERKPVFSVGVESRVYSGGDFREATVGAKVTLPWFNGSVYNANTERARQQEVAAQRQYEALERRLRGDYLAAYTDAGNAGQQAETFSREIIPRAETAAQATEAAWISTKATLLEVLEARRALLNARLEQRRSIALQRVTFETLRSIVPPSEKPFRP